jgi:hypothetical protein
MDPEIKIEKEVPIVDVLNVPKYATFNFFVVSRRFRLPPTVL